MLMSYCVFFSFCKSLCWFPHFSSKKVFGGFHQRWVILCRWVLDLSVIVPKFFQFDSGIIFQWHYCILSLSSVKIYLITFGLRVLPHPLLMGQSRLLCSFCFYTKTNKREFLNLRESFVSSRIATIVRRVDNSIKLIFWHFLDQKLYPTILMTDIC